MISLEDAEEVTIPMMILASEQEEKDMDAYEKALKVGKHVEGSGDQLHGLLSARAELKDEGKRMAYERVYGVLGGWFGTWL